MEKFVLENRNYSRRFGTYNACWLHADGTPAFWGNYNPDDCSFYLATDKSILASAMWVEDYYGNPVYQKQGSYCYEEVRRALQLGKLDY